MLVGRDSDILRRSSFDPCAIPDVMYVEARKNLVAWGTPTAHRAGAGGEPENVAPGTVSDGGAASHRPRPVRSRPRRAQPGRGRAGPPRRAGRRRRLRTANPTRDRLHGRPAGAGTCRPRRSASPVAFAATFVSPSRPPRPSMKASGSGTTRVGSAFANMFVACFPNMPSRGRLRRAARQGAIAPPAESPLTGRPSAGPAATPHASATTPAGPPGSA